MTRLPLRSAAQNHRANGTQLIAPALDDKRDDYIRRLVDAAPPLTPEQFDRLAALLRAPHGMP